MTYLNLFFYTGGLAVILLASTALVWGCVYVSYLAILGLIEPLHRPSAKDTQAALDISAGEAEFLDRVETNVDDIQRIYMKIYRPYSHSQV